MDTLITMRLVDMHKVHPQQVVKTCARCGEKVGVYPTGQKALAARALEIVCQVCIERDHDPDAIVEAAGSLDEIVQEARASQPVPKA